MPETASPPSIVTEHRTPNTDHRFSRTDAWLVVMATIWGVNFSVVKYATAIVDPLAYNAIRVTLAAVVLAMLAALAPGARLSRRDLLALPALGVLGNGVYQLAFVEGVAHMRAGDAALVIAATPAMIALIGRVAGVERVSRRGVFGIALSVAGIALVVFGTARGTAGSTTLVGSATILAGALCWAVFTVLLKPYANRIDGLRLAALTMSGGAMALLLTSGPALARLELRHVPAVAWGAMVYSGLGSLVVAYLIWQRGVRLLGPTRTAMYSNLQPAVALTVAWFVLHEVPTAWQAIGAVTIIAGVLLTRT
ncbi:MAG: DMT family transporter [Gemmatimonadaceae bacterium]